MSGCPQQPTSSRWDACLTGLRLSGWLEYGSAWDVAQALAPKLGVGQYMLSKWALQAQADGGDGRTEQ
jgi:hypothetical protein